MKPTIKGTSKVAAHDRTHWGTPDWIIAKVLRVMGGIDFDPCGNEASIERGFADETWSNQVISTPHKRRDAQDGLHDPWDGRQRVFMNPPYSRAQNPLWAAKFASECARYDGSRPAIALVPAETGCKWFRHYVDVADAIAFIGRVRFVGAPGKATFDSALIYCGDSPEVFAEAFKDHWGTLHKRTKRV